MSDNDQDMSHADGDHEATHGEILKAGGPGAGQIEVGMKVIGIDGHVVGRVKAVRGADFLLDRPMARDLYVPFQFVLSVPDQGEKPSKPLEVVLTVSGAHLDGQGWSHP
jgi:hypothetical protein